MARNTDQRQSGDPRPKPRVSGRAFRRPGDGWHPAARTSAIVAVRRSSALESPATSLIVVGRGRIKGTLPSPHADGEFIVSMFWPGDVFGEIPLFDNQSRAATATVVTEAEVLFVPRNELLALLERRPAVAIRLIEALCDKLRTSLEFSLALRFLDVPSRFYRRLIYLGRYDSRRDGNGVRIQHGLSQRELADSIGASREALNKLFGEWKRAGLLEYGRGFVVVPDPAALAMRMPPTVRQGSLVEACEPQFVDAEFSPERRRSRSKR